MRKIITITILFFSCLSFAQVKPTEVATSNEACASITVSSNNSEALNTEKSLLQKGNENCGNFYKKKGDDITENPLNNIKLTLPNNFNWLHFSLV